MHCFTLLNFDDYATATQCSATSQMNESASKCDFNWIKFALFFRWHYFLPVVLKSISSSMRMGTKNVTKLLIGCDWIWPMLRTRSDFNITFSINICTKHLLGLWNIVQVFGNNFFLSLYITLYSNLFEKTSCQLQVPWESVPYFGWFNELAWSLLTAMLNYNFWESQNLNIKTWSEYRSSAC